MIAFTNSLDLDLARRYVGPDLDLNVCHSDGIFKKDFFEKVDLKHNHQTTIKHKIPSMQRGNRVSDRSPESLQ